MYRSIRRVLAVIVSGFGFLAAANAATMEAYNVRDWEVGAYSDDKSNEFSHCAMAAGYRNGVMLIFLIDRSEHWYMGLANANWRLTPGEKYNFDIWLDGSRGRNWFGVAVEPTVLRVPLADSAALFEQFSRSQLLTVNAANGIYRFSLDNSRIGLAAVLACTERHLMASSGNPFVRSNPFRNGGAANQQVAAAANPALYSEAAVMMTNTLSSIGISGYKLLPVETVQKEFSGDHAVWFAKGTGGSLRILAEAQSTASVAAAVMAASAQDCDGKFATGKTEAGQALKIEAVCEDKKGTLTTLHHIVTPRPGGGVYVFTVVGLEQDNVAADTGTVAKVGDMILASAKK
jgi:hypothetical protein